MSLFYSISLVAFKSHCMPITCPFPYDDGVRFTLIALAIVYNDLWMSLLQTTAWQISLWHLSSEDVAFFSCDLKALKESCALSWITAQLCLTFIAHRLFFWNDSKRLSGTRELWARTRDASRHQSNSAANAIIVTTALWRHRVCLIWKWMNFLRKLQSEASWCSVQEA